MVIESGAPQALLREVPPFTLWAVPAAYVLGVGMLAFLVCRAWEWAALKLIHLDPDSHWTERARQLIVVQGTLPGAALICGIFFSLGPLGLHGPLTPFDLRLFILFAGVAAFMGAVIGLGRCERLIYGERATGPARWRSLGMSYLLFKPGLILLLVMLLLMPAQFGPGVVALVVAGLVFAWGTSRGWLNGLVQTLGIAKPADESLNSMVRDLANEVGQPMPKCFELDVLPANAAVLPMGNSLFVTRPLLQFPREQVRAILAHEFGHLAEVKSAMRVRMIAFFNVVILPLYIPVATTYGFWTGVLLVCGSFVLSLSIQRRLVHMETDADAAAKVHEGEDGTYARALEGIYRHNMIPAVMGAKALSHPHLYDRLEAAGITPDYGRPAGPPARSLLAVRAAIIFPMTLLVLGGMQGHATVVGRPWAGEGGEHLGVALTGGDGWSVFALAERLVWEGDVIAAVELADYAFRHEPDPYIASRLATLAMQTGDRDAALSALAECLRLDELRESPVYALDRGLIYFELGDLDLAAQELGRGDRQIGNAQLREDPWAHVKYAFLAKDLGREDDAEQALARGRALAVERDLVDRLAEYIAHMNAERAE